MYKIKQKPEDFIVEELSDIEIKDKGRYSYFLLTKEDYTTVRAVQHISDALKIRPKDIGFAGTKDRHAVTKQVISIRNTQKDRVERLSLKDITLEFKGYGDEPISLGDLEGNRFTIIVRNIETSPKPLNRFTNFFGEQRFSRNNKEVGKALIKKDFKSAASLILESKGDYEEKMEAYLKQNPTDHVGALATIPKKILMLYIHAYQSGIWNQVAEELEKTKEDTIKVPLVGFGTDLSHHKITTRILKEEGISPRDFIIKQLPNLSSEGDERDLFCEIKDLKIGPLEEDELNQGMKKVRLQFTLRKGSYATEAVKALFNDS